jgi:2-polyprenyl-3-methyl-5-hydroxy-6-metoxy-1,4-benzoquinol methylase
MRQPTPQVSWPDSWVHSFAFDREEVFGPISNRGYAYAYDTRRAITHALLAGAMPPPARVIDIAAAQGNFALALAEQGYDVTWNDLREELAGYVRLKHEHGLLRYAPGNAFELSFEQPFDVALITEVIEHVAHPDDFLRCTARLVRPGGCIVMTTPNGAHLRNTLPRFSDCPDPSAYESGQFKPDADGHIFLLHPDEVHRLAREAGLVVETLVHFTNPLTNGHLKTRRVLDTLPRRVIESIESATQRLPRALGHRLNLQLGARLRKPASA